MQVNIYSFTKEIWFDAEISEYFKRISYKVNLIRLKPSNSSDAEVAKRQEAEIFLSKYKSKNSLILLDESGKLYNSLDFANWFEKVLNTGRDIDFLIGGAFGLDKSLYEQADYMISLSQLTFPHKFIPLLLAEQIYRAISIIKNHPYHKL